MILIKRFSDEFSLEWNEFISKAKNGLFLFDRGYMEYHSDRFYDHSLLLFNDDELLAVLPATQQGNTLSSHAGLTFGGLILHKRASISFVLEVFEALKNYLKEIGITILVYKSIPYIYHQLPAQEDLYALFRNNAELFRRDVNSVIDLSVKPSYTKGTKYNLGKAKKNNVKIEQNFEFNTFMNIVTEILVTKYKIKPTHTVDEITLLANRFPNNIKLYMAFCEEVCMGGVVIYETKRVVHSQYIGITEEGKNIGALDALIDHLVHRYSVSHAYFSFGISTEDSAKVLNEGLVRNKESFGARTIVHDFYKIFLA